MKKSSSRLDNLFDRGPGGRQKQNENNQPDKILFQKINKRKNEKNQNDNRNRHSVSDGD